MFTPKLRKQLAPNFQKVGKLFLQKYHRNPNGGEHTHAHTLTKCTHKHDPSKSLPTLKVFATNILIIIFNFQINVRATDSVKYYHNKNVVQLG